MKHLIPILLACLLAGTAFAKIPLCIKVVGPGVAASAMEGIEALVRDEVRRHPSHSPVSEGCEATLNVELVELTLDGGKRRVATVYLDGQTPHRRELGSAETFAEHLELLVSAALGTDPQRVMEDDRSLADALGVVESRPLAGEMLYGVEVGQASLFRGGEATFSPALSVRIRRGLGEFHVGARLRAAFMPVEPTADGAPVATVNVALEPEFAWFVAPDAAISFYLAAAVGITVIRYDGYEDGRSDALVDWGVHATARMGVEFLRTADFRLDLFASATLPWFVTDSEASLLVDDWTPTVEVGFGVAF